MRWSHALAASTLALSAQMSSATSLPPCPTSSHLVDTISAVWGKTARIMWDRLAKLDHETTDQIIALTLDDVWKYGYWSMRELWIAYVEACKIGSKKTDRGVLVTYEKWSSKYTIETSRGLEGPIPDINTRNKVFEIAKKQCEKKSPWCILDKSTIQLENILRANPAVVATPVGPFSPSTRAIPVRPPSLPATAVPESQQENSLDSDGVVAVGWIMLTSLLAGLWWMGLRNRRVRWILRSSPNGTRNSRDDFRAAELKRVLWEIDTLKWGLLAEWYLLWEIPALATMDQYRASSMTWRVLDELQWVRTYYQGLSWFSDMRLTQFQEASSKYQGAKVKHDAIYGNSAHPIDLVSLKSSLDGILQRFGVLYSQKDIPKLRWLQNEVATLFGSMNNATTEYTRATEVYDAIPTQVSSRRQNLTKISNNPKYVQDEEKYRRKTGEARFRWYSIPVKISEMNTLLDAISATHTNKTWLSGVSRLLRNFDTLYDALIEYTQLWARLRQILENEREAQRKAEREAQEEQDLLLQRRAAAIIYASSWNTWGSRNDDNRVPDRWWAGFAGGWTEVTIEPERDSDGNDSGRWDDNNEDQ